MSEFLKVKRAFVVLDPNGRNELNIEFDEPIPEYSETRAKIINDEYGGYMFYLEDRGIAHFGCYDPNGKFWSSRPSVFRDYGDHPIEVSFVTPSKFIGFSRTAGAITETFCKKILADFNIPFHIEEITPFSDKEIVSVLVQDRSLIGKTFTDSRGITWRIADRSPYPYDVTRYVCFSTNSSESRYFGAAEMPGEFYDGLFWDEFKEKYKEDSGD